MKKKRCTAPAIRSPQRKVGIDKIKNDRRVALAKVTRQINKIKPLNFVKLLKPKTCAYESKGSRSVIRLDAWY